MSKDLTPLEVFYKGKRILAKYEHDTKDHLIEIDLKQSEWNIIDIALKDAEKNKKALEIIKNKCQFFSLESDEDDFCPKGHYRVYDAELYQFNELTKEEYELLREMLKWVNLFSLMMKIKELLI